MNKEIKFRGKRLGNSEWVYGSYISFNDWIEEEVRHNQIADRAGYVYDVDPETIGEFTGLKDKNGREIYEGDIVCLGDTKRRTGVIVRSETEPAFVLEVNDTAFDLYYRNQHRYEVVGNIHDTPELLKTVRHE